jgi:hypothetical protein
MMASNTTSVITAINNFTGNRSVYIDWLNMQGPLWPPSNAALNASELVNTALSSGYTTCRI